MWRIRHALVSYLAFEIIDVLSVSRLSAFAIFLFQIALQFQ